MSKATIRRPLDVELQLEIDRLMSESSFQVNPVIIRNIAKKNIDYVSRLQQEARQEKRLERQGWSNRPLAQALQGAIR